MHAPAAQGYLKPTARQGHSGSGKMVLGVPSCLEIRWRYCSAAVGGWGDGMERMPLMAVAQRGEESCAVGECVKPTMALSELLAQTLFAMDAY